ncbi:MAG TPA: nucleoside deaminase [Candidatus Coprenecus pullicola]|nr:nucleoside deaminase [Candidatus Coprenecus pullicola]
MTANDHMRRAISLAEDNASSGNGGPFGAVIVKDGKVVAEGSNTVTVDNDPTAHAEVNAIRRACAVLGTFDLSGCELYTSCEPCPMCLAACYWAHISRVYYAAGRDDAAAAGFDDDMIYVEVAKPLDERKLPFTQLLPEEGLRPFLLWRSNPDKVRY